MEEQMHNHFFHKLKKAIFRTKIKHLQKKVFHRQTSSWRMTAWIWRVLSFVNKFQVNIYSQLDMDYFPNWILVCSQIIQTQYYFQIQISTPSIRWCRKSGFWKTDKRQWQCYYLQTRTPTLLWEGMITRPKTRTVSHFPLPIEQQDSCYISFTISPMSGSMSCSLKCMILLSTAFLDSLGPIMFALT